MDLDEWVNEKRKGVAAIHKELPDWRERFADRSFWNDYSEYLERRHSERDGEDEEVEYPDEFLEFYGTLSKMNFDCNMDLVFRMAESPIEKLLMSQIVFTFSRYHPFSLIVPYPDILDRYMQAVDNVKAVEAIQGETGRDFSEIQEELLSENEKTEAIILPFLFECSCRFDCVFMFPQAYFDRDMGELFPELKPILPMRPDILFTHLKTKAKLVVECDGFEYHKEKENFKKDRKRDRVLKHAGFETMRFAGSEIYSDPENCAFDIFDYIRKHWHFNEFFND